MNNLKFNSATIEGVAGKLATFVSGKDGVPCVLTLGAGNMGGHVVNTLICIHKGYKFQYVFLSKEGTASEPATIVVDASSIASVLRGICMFKSDVAMQIAEGKLQVSTSSAKQEVPATVKTVEQFADEAMPVLQYAVAGEAFSAAVKKSLSIESDKSVAMSLDSDGKLYTYATDGHRVAYEQVPVEVNQSILVFGALQKALTGKQGEIKEAIEKQNASYFESFGGVSSHAEGAFQIVVLTVGGSPVMALTVRDGALLDDTRTFMAGSDEEKQQLLAVPSIHVEMQETVEEYFKAFTCERYLLGKDVRLISGLFAGAEKVNVTVFGKSMQLAMDGLALSVPFAEKDIPDLAGIRKVVPKDINLVAEVDSAELQTALAFLIEAGAGKEQNSPLCVSYEKDKLKLSVLQANAVVEVPLKSEIPEGLEPGFLNMKYLKQALGYTEKGTVAFSRANGVYTVSGIRNDQPDMDHMFLILGVKVPKNVQEAGDSDK